MRFADARFQGLCRWGEHVRKPRLRARRAATARIVAQLAVRRPSDLPTGDTNLTNSIFDSTERFSDADLTCERGSSAHP
jgi:hypothetical protein